MADVYRESRIPVPWGQGFADCTETFYSLSESLDNTKPHAHASFLPDSWYFPSDYNLDDATSNKVEDELFDLLTYPATDTITNSSSEVDDTQTAGSSSNLEPIPESILHYTPPPPKIYHIGEFESALLAPILCGDTTDVPLTIDPKEILPPPLPPVDTSSNHPKPSKKSKKPRKKRTKKTDQSENVPPPVEGEDTKGYARCQISGCGELVLLTEAGVEAHATAVHGSRTKGSIPCPWPGCTATLQRESIRRHFIPHFGVKNMCQRCHKEFSRSDSLMRHLRSRGDCTKEKPKPKNAGLRDSNTSNKRKRARDDSDDEDYDPDYNPNTTKKCK